MDLKDLNTWIGNPIMQKQLEEAWVNDDISACLICFSNMEGINFLMDNIRPLLDSELYEETLLHALIAPRVNLHHIPFDLLKYLLHKADQQKMMECGEKIPFTEPFVLYRGVAGHGPARRKRGLSWSASFERAKWFADRGAMFGLNKPMVYQATVPLEYVYAYINERQEQEFICLLPDNHKLKKVYP